MEEVFKNSTYGFSLKQSLIAQEPCSPRDKSRLLVVERSTGCLRQGVFSDIVSFFQEGDCLVLNNTKVIKARITGEKETGAKIEILLLKEEKKGLWECLLNPLKRVKENTKIFFPQGFQAVVRGKTQTGLIRLEFFPEKVASLMEAAGETPVPPYVKKKSKLKKYQTVYAKKAGAVAAPTAGLHFTNRLINKIKQKGVKVAYLTLHCGLGTFRPVKKEDIRHHDMAPEYLELSLAAAKTINQAKKNKRKIYAVGTTAVRSLESAATTKGKLKPFLGMTGLYIVPGYKFTVVDGLITNFHTPFSSNLILVSAFSSLNLIKKAYHYAEKEKFRFFSFGDAMLIL